VSGSSFPSSLSYQEPARQAFLYVGTPIGDGGVRGLDHEGLRKMQEVFSYRCALFHRLTKVVRLHVVTSTGNLDIGQMRRAVIAHYDVDSRHAFAPDKPNLALSVACARSDDRNDAAFWEVNMSNRLVGALNGAPKLKPDRDEMRLQKREIDSRKRRKQMIAGHSSGG